MMCKPCLNKILYVKIKTVPGIVLRGSENFGSYRARWVRKVGGEYVGT